MEEIIDFRDTAEYAHVSLKHPNYDVNNIAVVYSLDVQSKIVFIKDAYEKSIHGSDDIILNLFRKNGAMQATEFTHNADGIYDIWLKDCVNVESIEIFSQCAGVLYQSRINPDLKEFQIQLAFNTQPVKHWFIRSIGLAKLEMSFIPLISMTYDKLVLRINEGGKAKLVSSLVWVPKDMRRRIVMASQNTFYMNGKAIHTRCGTCSTGDENVCCIS